MGIERDDEILTPKGDTEIKAGDVVTLFSPGEASKETIEAFTDPVESVK